MNIDDIFELYHLRICSDENNKFSQCSRETFVQTIIEFGTLIQEEKVQRMLQIALGYLEYLPYDPNNCKYLIESQPEDTEGYYFEFTYYAQNSTDENIYIKLFNRRERTFTIECYLD